MVNTSALESRGRGFKSRSRQFLEFHLCSFISFFHWVQFICVIYIYIIYIIIYSFTWIFELGLTKKSAHSITWKFKTMKNH